MFFAFLAWFLWFIITKCDKVERQRMIVLALLTIFSVVFWALFEQSSASMTLFADRVVDRTVVGSWELTAVQTASLNAMFIFLLAPVFAWLWTFLSKKKMEPNTPAKFGLGILQVGLGFGALVIGSNSPDDAGKVALIWLALAYLLHTTGELCLSPVGLSAVTKLSVGRVVGVMMGFWFFATAYSELVAAQIAKIAAIDTEGGVVTDVSAALSTYSEFFTQLLYIGGGFGLLVLLLSPLLRRLMHGIH
jgi:POT family proton-dependent oligopeptide transporter